MLANHSQIVEENKFCTCDSPKGLRLLKNIYMEIWKNTYISKFDRIMLNLIIKNWGLKWLLSLSYMLVKRKVSP